MEVKNLEKVLTEYAKDFEVAYKSKMDSNFRILSSIKTNVKVLGNTYQVVLSLEDYWKWIEEGRKPGKQPPPDKLISWIRHRGIKPRDGITSEKSLAYLIGRKIGKEGIKPRRYLAQAQEEFTDRRKEIINAFREDIKEYITGIFSSREL